MFLHSFLNWKVHSNEYTFIWNETGLGAVEIWSKFGIDGSNNRVSFFHFYYVAIY